MPDDHGGVFVESVEESHYVADKMKERVLFDLSGTIALAVTSHVGGNGMEAGIRECPQLVAPGVPRLRKPMAKHNEWATPLLGDVHANTVCLDDAVLNVPRVSIRVLCG
jgi:hypothetical protein